MTRLSSSVEIAPATPADWRRRIASTAVALLACAAAAAPLLDRVNAYTLISPAVIAVLAIWVLWRGIDTARKAGPGGMDASASIDPERAPQPLSRLLLGVLPVWRQHVVSAKGQIDDAVSELVVNFASITDEFEAAGFKGAAGSTSESDATASLLVLCESDLQQVVAAMSEISSSKGAMAASINELARATADLQSMAQGVAQIAAQTNLLAINAAIEAAHAGDSGRGFATIAKEIRVLSQSSAQTASQITDRIARVTAIMNETSDAAVKAETQEGSSIERSNRVVSDVLSHMRTLSADAETMRERGNVIRMNIERLIVGLQFQDRVSQVISVVDGDITRLREKVEGDEPLPEPDQWLEDLKRHYTMREQRQSLGSGGTGSKAQAAAPAPRKVVFF